MKHGLKKIRFGKGQDANIMLLRKLTNNFFLKGNITTTYKRAKILKQHVDTLVGKIGDKSEASKNILLKYIGSPGMVSKVMEQIGDSSKSTSGGHVRVQKLLFRTTDGAAMAKVTWTHPVVIEPEPVKEEVKVKEVKAKKDKKVKA